jgi:hypothetical protein
VESESGVGTAFHVELPTKPPHHQTAPVVIEEEKQEA